MKRSYIILGFILAIAIGFHAGNFWNSYKYNRDIPEHETINITQADEVIHNHGESDIDFGLFDDVWEILNEKYVNPEVFQNDDSFEYGVIKGLVSGLDDPFSAFMTPEENKEFRDELHGNFEGIGAELTMKSGAITVVTPLKGSPAKQAGLMPEDIIIKVNDEDVTGEELFPVVQKIRGEKGTQVKLTVYRSSIIDTLDIEITRDVITVASVESQVENGIGIIEINQFGDETRKEYAKQFRSVIEQNPEGLILDLRFNGGGYLDGAVDIASAFFEPGIPVVEVRTRNNSFWNKTSYKAFTNTEVPLIVLINRGSASASEIVAGAVQDHDRGLVIGEQSFGKGTVQEVVPLKKGASLRITIAEWFTPNGNSITKTGITPDIIVERTREDFDADIDPQLEKAIEILQNGNWKEFLVQEPTSTQEPE